MSSWGRCQDAVDQVLFGYDYGYGKREPGFFDLLGITYSQVREVSPDLTEKLIEAIYPIAYAQGQEFQRKESSK